MPGMYSGGSVVGIEKNFALNFGDSIRVLWMLFCSLPWSVILSEASGKNVRSEKCPYNGVQTMRTGTRTEYAVTVEGILRSRSSDARTATQEDGVLTGAFRVNYKLFVSLVKVLPA